MRFFEHADRLRMRNTNRDEPLVDSLLYNNTGKHLKQIQIRKNWLVIITSRKAPVW